MWFWKHDDATSWRYSGYMKIVQFTYELYAWLYKILCVCYKCVIIKIHNNHGCSKNIFIHIAWGSGKWNFLFWSWPVHQSNPKLHSRMTQVAGKSSPSVIVVSPWTHRNNSKLSNISFENSNVYHFSIVPFKPVKQNDFTFLPLQREI